MLVDLAAKYYALDRWQMPPAVFDDQPGFEMDLLCHLDHLVQQRRQAEAEAEARRHA